MNFPTPFGFQAGNGPDGNEFSKAIRDHFPTPVASDSRGDPNLETGTWGGSDLRSVAKGEFFPTPKASTGGPDPEGRATGKNLANVSRSFLPPETTPPDGDGYSPTAPTSGPLFSTATTLGDAAGGSHSRKTHRKMLADFGSPKTAERLWIAVRNELAIAYGISGARESPLLNRHLNPSRFSAKLNPNFVDWLMGFPPGWTSARIGSVVRETASSPPKPQKLSTCSGKG